MPDPVEAKIVRDVAEQLLDGASVPSVVASLRGIPTTRSDYRRARLLGKDPEGLDRGVWQLSTIRTIWTSESQLGRTLYRGEVVRDGSGLPLAPFPPNLDVGTVTRLRERFAGHSGRPGQRRVRHARLLSGVAYCGECNSKLYVTTSNGRVVYGCGGAARTESDCPGPRTTAESFEDFVGDHWLSIYGALPEVEEVTIVHEAGARDALAEIEAAIAETTVALGTDHADVPALVRRLDALKARRTELRQVKSRIEVVERPTGRTWAEAWHSAPSADARRRLLLHDLDHVTLSVGRPYVFDTSRVRFFWTS